MLEVVVVVVVVDVYNRAVFSDFSNFNKTANIIYETTASNLLNVVHGVL